MRVLTFFLSTLTIACLSLTACIGQERAHTDYALQLKDGSVFRGQIMAYQPGDSLVFRLSLGGEMHLHDDQVKRILPYSEYESPGRKRKSIDRSYRLPEQGWRHHIGLGGYFGRNDSPELGGGIYYAFGYAFHRAFELGAGIGYDGYSVDYPQRFMPMFIQLHGAVTRSWIAPVYTVQAGYSLAFKDQQTGVREAQGGVLVHPAVGLRFGARKSGNLTMDVGYRFQYAEHIRDWFWEDSFVEEIRWYQRLTIRLAVQL